MTVKNEGTVEKTERMLDGEEYDKNAHAHIYVLEVSGSFKNGGSEGDTFVYVGETTQYPTERIEQHIVDCNRGAWPNGREPDFLCCKRNVPLGAKIPFMENIEPPYEIVGVVRIDNIRYMDYEWAESKQIRLVKERAMKEYLRDKQIFVVE